MVYKEYELCYYRLLNDLEKIMHPHDKSEELTKCSHYLGLENSIMWLDGFHSVNFFLNLSKLIRDQAITRSPCSIDLEVETTAVQMMLINPKEGNM